MVKIKSTARFFNQVVKNVILTQTDTTVGFLSQDEKKLQQIKARFATKPFIKVYKNFKAFTQNNRVANQHKNLVRRSKKRTFIIKNRAFRVAQTDLHSSFLQNEWNYSTSANESGKNFNRVFCEEKADIIIEDKNSLYEGKASKLYKLGVKTTRRLR